MEMVDHCKSFFAVSVAYMIVFDAIGFVSTVTAVVFVIAVAISVVIVLVVYSCEK